MHDNLPDVRDGLTRVEGIVLTVLRRLQREREGRSVPTAMLYGHVVEQVNLSPAEFPALLALPAAAAATEEQNTAAAGIEVQAGLPTRGARLDRVGLLRRTFKEDVLECRRCGGRRRVVAYLTHVPAVRQVLVHLKLPADTPPLSPSRGPPQADVWP